MSRFERHGQRVYSARDAVGAVALVALLLVLFSGGSIRDAAAQIDPGIGQDVVEAVGGPTDWVADRLPLDEAQRELTAGLSPDTELGGGGFDEAAAATPGAARVPAGHPRRLRPRRDRRPAAAEGSARDAPGHRRLALDPARHRARPAPLGRRDRGDPRPASGHRDLELGPDRLGRALDRTGGRRPSPTRWSSSSAPTRATRCRAPVARRSSAAGPSTRRSTPTGCAR